MKQHSDLVNEFMQKCKRENPDLYREVCEKYQTIDNRRWRKIKERERCVGLLGLQPAAVSSDIALRHDLESSLAMEPD